MKKIRLQISVVVCLWFSLSAAGQDYTLRLKGADRDSAWLVSNIGIETRFNNRFTCSEYLAKLPDNLRARGYVTASFDTLRFDSTFANLTLFLGDVYKWAILDARSIEPEILGAVAFNQQTFAGQAVNFNQVAAWQDKMLTHLENNGYPFARVYLDSLHLKGEEVTARLRINRGPAYKIDSIRVFGTARISNEYLQRYLDIPNGSRYSKEKLLRVSRRLRDLSFVEETQPSNLTRLGDGSVLNVYLAQKKTSQINLLLGFLPNNDQLASKKLLLTGEANINLRNAFGSGEAIGLNWQQLQVKSPRLNLYFQYPYVFHSPVGLDISFDIFRKDSTFVNINLQAGAQYVLNAQQSGKLFIQRASTIVNGFNTSYVLQNRRLTDEADVSSTNVGIDYEYNNTDYRLNPRKGNEFRIITSAGIKKIKRNNAVLELKDPNDPNFDFASLYDTLKLKSYQLRIRASAARYFAVGRQSTVKTAINAGLLQSGNIFRNELFQLGGYKLLRGFDEESQYLSQYAIGTIEYRLLYLAGRNSYLYVLADGGWGRNNSNNIDESYTYFGTGIGIAFETKAGVFNLAWAVGKRNDTEFNLRQSKIHFGFVNYF